MRYRQRLAPVLDHVRENLRGDLSVAALARVAHFSPYHFHRVFTSVMGETVAVYVRRARLERAVQLMRSAPARPLGRIALECGFGSSSAFSRTFRRHYALAPAEWDRRSPLAFRDGDREPPGEPSAEARRMARADRGPEPEVRLETEPARTLAYVRIRRPFRPGALDAGYARLRTFLAERGLPEVEGGLLGLSWDDVEVTPPDRIRYDLACTVPDGTGEGDGVGVRELPALRVAWARARGDLSRVARIWDHLYHEWLPRSRWEPWALPAFERYRGWPDALEGELWDLDCCIPLRPLR